MPHRVSSRPAKMLALTLRSGNASISWCTIDPLGQRVARPGERCRPAIYRQLAAVGTQAAGKDLEERRLTRAVLADERVGIPAATSKLTPSSARTPPNDFRMSRNETAAALIVVHSGPGPGRRQTASRAGPRMPGLQPVDPARMRLCSALILRQGRPRRRHEQLVEPGTAERTARRTRDWKAHHAIEDAIPRVAVQPASTPERHPDAVVDVDRQSIWSAILLGNGSERRRFPIAPVARSKSNMSMRWVGLST